MNNLPRYRSFSFQALALKAQGKSAKEPDVSYYFSNGKKFVNQNNTGAYKK
jgi:hypothetical protein